MAKPNMKQLMDATGVDAATASSMLYGVVGANKDVRDWGSIMSASDPLSAARQATFQMYASPEATEKTRTSGNYASIVPSSGAPSIVRYTDPDSEKTSFAIVAADGTPLRAGFSTEEQARKQGADFGITGSVATGQYLAPLPVSPPPVAQPVAPPPVFQPAVFQPPPAPAPLLPEQSLVASQLLPFQTQQPMSVAAVPPPPFQQPTLQSPMLPSLLPSLSSPQQGSSPFTFEQYLAPPPSSSQTIQSVYGNFQPADPMQQGIMGLPSAGFT